ncbi:PDZ domain-containing protein [Jatrophihabitans endophyticus]|uniref:endopeptidase La n=1 Tax=Jatrophihabitans endophyticus TaxID=1206085 RepID=A0A1M5EP29_9ACTN|nr:PDZ domain-containing protein [Jatrophihabitans endophyticus]
MPFPPAESVPGGTGFARLSRRVRSLIVAGVLFVVLFALIFSLPVPYVVLSPGPTYNTLGADDGGRSIIKISGTTVRRTTGNLNLTTVGVNTDSVTPYQAFVGWLKGDEVVVPRASVYPPGQSQQQTDKQNTQDFVTSQDSAVTAASCELGYAKAFGVVSVLADGASAGKLRTGDALVSLDGGDASSAGKLRALLAKTKAGDTVTVTVRRNGATKEVPVTLSAAPKGQQGGRLGVSISDGCLAPFTVDLGLANQIGGPSAGLMFALGIIDKVGPRDLTKGRFIAGTGTIDPDGTVGPIGGIQLKMIAARAKGATVFLAPEDNCDDVRGNVPDGLRVVKVSTLHDAVSDLEKIEQGQAVPSC